MAEQYSVLISQAKKKEKSFVSFQTPDKMSHIPARWASPASADTVEK